MGHMSKELLLLCARTRRVGGTCVGLFTVSILLVLVNLLLFILGFEDSFSFNEINRTALFVIVRQMDKGRE